MQAEVNFLGQLQHPNLVKLLGYCLEGEDRLLVYEFMARGSLENHLFRSKSTLFLTYSLNHSSLLLLLLLCACKLLFCCNPVSIIWKQLTKLLCGYHEISGFNPAGYWCSLFCCVLFSGTVPPLSWETRIKVAVGAARGLAVLHNSQPEIIYRDFKASNILLDLVSWIKTCLV